MVINGIGIGIGFKNIDVVTILDLVTDVWLWDDGYQILWDDGFKILLE